LKKKLIVALIIFEILATCLFAQYDFTFSGGINLGSFGGNSGNSFSNTSMKTGLTLGVETMKGPLIIGASFVRRGGNREISSVGYSESVSLDYITAYLLLSIPIVKSFSGLFGCQIGECMGGTIDYEYDDDTGAVVLYTDAFNIDFGIFFGADYMLNSRIGVRTSYYAGYIGVLEGSASNNFKNRGIGICLLYKI